MNRSRARAWIGLALSASGCLAAAPPGFVGSATCAPCHREISASQSRGNMALTFQGQKTTAVSPVYRNTKDEAGITYQVERTPAGFTYRVTMPGDPPVTSRVEAIVGGRRHGLSFLTRIFELDGLKLARPALVETRYLHSSVNRDLVLSPGFPETAPANWGAALGRVLSPDFETKCLNCHGALNDRSPRETGVRCETCHGPAADHLKAVSSAAKDHAIQAFKKSAPDARLELCAQCHAGFGDIQDPLPRDLLISNQVNALRNSQCFLQSGGALDCLSCHSPHHDADHDQQRSVATCLSCHGQNVVRRAALCPVNKQDKCLDCHMPVATQGSFHMVDHWIRVHPDRNLSATAHIPADRTRVQPLKLYLRLIVTPDRASADRALSLLDNGTAFFDVAQEYSKEEHALSGGYLGEMLTSQVEPRLAAAALSLDRGQHSRVLEIGGKFMIVARLQRDFLYTASRLAEEATRLRDRGQLDEAVSKYQEALKIYPRFLRALVFLGGTLGAQGNTPRATAVLDYAARLYPRDPAAQYNLGIAYGAAGKTEEEIAAYRRAIQLQPDLAAAYLNLGGSLLAAGRLDEALKAYRDGLVQDPLASSLYYNLSIVYEQLGRPADAKAAAALAAKLDPRFRN